MSFRLRIVLVTTILIAILFGIGGAVLVQSTFQTSLEKEEEAAVDSNVLILKVVQYVGEDGTWFGEEELVSVIKEICSQGSIDCMRLIRGNDVIYVYQREKKLDAYLKEVEALGTNQMEVSYFTDEAGERYLQTTAKFILNGQEYFLDMGRDLSAVYSVRKEVTSVYQKSFIVLIMFGILLSAMLATLLTRPLRRLTKASRELAAGNLSYRSSINTDDEIGDLSRAFDMMAEKQEHTIILLKESAEQKEMFMGAFTHELKTPMTSIIGYADLLRTQKLSEKDNADALDYIFSEAKRLENLSLKMLDLFVADKKAITLKTCNPAKLTRHVAKHLQPLCEKSNVQMEVSAMDGTCHLEQDLFQTLLINLIDNARKSMEQGGLITIAVSLTSQGCILTVTDTGKGIPKEALNHLTEAFYRVDKARARSKGSIGLGLALCDKIVQLHRGYMEFDSEVGKGTKVTVVLNGGRDEA